MSHWKAYATAVIVGVLVLAPTAAHANIVWIDNGSLGIDCSSETLVEANGDGTLSHYPALPYEIESYCGVPATIEWSDEQQSGAPLKTVAATPAVSEPATVAPVEAAPPAPRQAPERDHGHSTHQRAV